MAFLKFILVIFIIGLVAVCWIAYKFFKSVSDATKGVNRRNAQRQTRMQSGTYGNQEGVVDQRNPEQVARKIIPSDEGEYVDFEEEK